MTRAKTGKEKIEKQEVEQQKDDGSTPSPTQAKSKSAKQTKIAKTTKTGKKTTMKKRKPTTVAKKKTVSVKSNPKTIIVGKEKVKLKNYIKEHEELESGAPKLNKFQKKGIRRYYREEELKPYQAELIKLQQCLERTGKKMIILFEGRDAAGKGGTIRRVSRYMNEKHYRVVALGKPTEEQKTQWFFQKYIAMLPCGGEVVMFDRSWYNRAVVEPVFEFCTTEEHRNFMRGVTGFEKDLVRQGTYLVKLYFSVTREEQAKRFNRRKTDPLRQWKLSEIDVQAQDRWADFTTRKYEMLRRTHTNIAPWTIIRSNNKHLARLNAMKVILNAVPYKRLNKNLDFVPDPDIVISGAREKELMDAQRIKLGDFVG